MKAKIFFILFFVMTANFVNAQISSCRYCSDHNFKNLVDSDYQPDGKYNVYKLKQGDEIEIYKSFYNGRKYMLSVYAEEVLPGVMVEVSDMKHQVILTSDNMKNKQTLEIKPERNKNLIISLKIIDSEEYDKDIFGCVSFAVGYK